MRGLTARQATACEHATTARCRCRCGGALHGAGRFADPDEAYRVLDDDDPHLPHLDANHGRQLRLPGAP